MFTIYYIIIEYLTQLQELHVQCPKIIYRASHKITAHKIQKTTKLNLSSQLSILSSTLITKYNHKSLQNIPKYITLSILMYPQHCTRGGAAYWLSVNSIYVSDASTKSNVGITYTNTHLRLKCSCISASNCCRIRYSLIL